MAKANPAKLDENGKQAIETLQQRYQSLNTKMITAKANLATAEKTLEGLKADARQKYGTDDLAELEKKLQMMKDENESKRANYQADLDKIEHDLSAVEQEFKCVEAPGGKE